MENLNLKYLDILEAESGEKRSLDISTAILVAFGDCRPDMHEPDNSGLVCKVVGTRLDNAFGNYPLSGEYVLMVGRDGDEETLINLNLADVIALARIGAEEVRNKFCSAETK